MHFFSNLFAATQAWADNAPAPAAAPATSTAPQGVGGLIGSPMFMMVVLIAIFYFLLIRPQQKKAKEHRQMLEALKRGDKVVTSGGLYGVIDSVEGETFTIKIAENVKVKIGKGYITAVRSDKEE